MTTVKEVENQLAKFFGAHKLAEEFFNNDIIKMKIAISYDDWVNDHPQSEEEDYGGLEGHVEYCLIHPELLGIKIEPHS